MISRFEITTKCLRRSLAEGTITGPGLSAESLASFWEFNVAFLPGFRVPHHSSATVAKDCTATSKVTYLYNYIRFDVSVPDLLCSCHCTILHIGNFTCCFGYVPMSTWCCIIETNGWGLPERGKRWKTKIHQNNCQALDIVLVFCCACAGMFWNELDSSWLLKGVDMSMNVHMKNIKFTVKGKPPVSMDHLTIRGNNVRPLIRHNICTAEWWSWCTDSQKQNGRS